MPEGSWFSCSDSYHWLMFSNPGQPRFCFSLDSAGRVGAGSLWFSSSDFLHWHTFPHPGQTGFCHFFALANALTRGRDSAQAFPNAGKGSPISVSGRFFTLHTSCIFLNKSSRTGNKSAPPGRCALRLSLHALRNQIKLLLPSRFMGCFKLIYCSL